MASKVLVVGSGVIGLRTALEFLKKNVPVVIRSANNPLHTSTCSMGAGGLWMPYKCDDQRVDKWAIETLDELLKLSKLPQEKNSVEIVPTLYLTSSHRGPTVDDFVKSDYKSNSKAHHYNFPEWTRDRRIGFQHLTIEMLCWQNHVLKLRIPSQDELLDAGYTHAWLFHPPIVDPPQMLTEMFEKVKAHPLMEESYINMNVTYTSLDEIIDDAKSLGCDAVVNCTGLGASSICNDSSIKGGRGALLHYDRECARREDFTTSKDHDACILTEEGAWGTSTEPCYMIPRGDVLVVGGSYKENDFESNILDCERGRLESNAWNLGIDTNKVNSFASWVGWRPCRPQMCVEIDKKFTSENLKVVHSYGAGGSGWTTFIGIAKENVRLTLQGLDS